MAKYCLLVVVGRVLLHIEIALISTIKCKYKLYFKFFNMNIEYNLCMKTPHVVVGFVSVNKYICKYLVSGLWTWWLDGWEISGKRGMYRFVY